MGGRPGSCYSWARALAQKIYSSARYLSAKSCQHKRHSRLMRARSSVMKPGREVAVVTCRRGGLARGNSDGGEPQEARHL